ncbi:armadillo-type protein [Zychaea mexicana]|uniref:armadillo-type protein n=1 Tax=Zychaea mexicana TaxID=64656 RepID=UPI0022FEFED0|nr:armadillo-type protein [Zychaea mexicana]KAI9488712.1 armadillo-type protein [Zychaea mexicana]
MFRSRNSWLPPHLRKQQQQQQQNDEQHKRKVNGLLNKLTAENFDSISDQVWDQARQGNVPHKTLKDVVEMVFIKACDQHQFAESWARLCKKLNDSMDLPENKSITDPDVKDTKNNDRVVSGRLLFRRYLLDRCQQQFEAAASSGEQKKQEEKTEMLSDAYYDQVKAKRMKLGLAVFIGELYKQKLLVDNVVKGCLNSLVEDVTAVTDQELEMVCKLLLTVGALFDSVNTTEAWLSHYMRRIKLIMETNTDLSTRAKFMVMDLIDLRKRSWVAKR